MSTEAVAVAAFLQHEDDEADIAVQVMLDMDNLVIEDLPAMLAGSTLTIDLGELMLALGISSLAPSERERRGYRI